RTVACYADAFRRDVTPIAWRDVAFHDANDDSSGARDLGCSSSGRDIHTIVERVSRFCRPLVLARRTQRRQEYLSALHRLDGVGCCRHCWRHPLWIKMAIPDFASVQSGLTLARAGVGLS